MTNQITYANFDGELTLVLTVAQQAKLALYITRYQKECLELLLGFNLYADLDTAYSTPPTSGKYYELINGVATYYTYNGYKRKYTGLKKLITAYVYYQWGVNETSNATTQGETVDLSPNGESVFNVGKIVNAYNLFIDLFYEAINYIDYKNSTEGSDYYADFETTYINKINSFGI